jgi:hypothetical protein
MITKYASAAFTCAAALTGIIGDTHDAAFPGVPGVTLLGWAAIVAVLLGFIIIILETYRDQKKINWQTQQRKRIEEIAHAEIRLAIKQITAPFFSLFGDSNKESVFEIIPERIEDSDSMAAVLRVELRSNNPGELMSGHFEETWDKVLKMNADHGAERIDRAMQIYGTYLEPSVLESLYDIRTSEFLVLRLQRLDELVEMNTKVEFLSFPFPNFQKGDDLHAWGYGKFWKTVRILDDLLVKDEERLHRRM